MLLAQGFDALRSTYEAFVVFELFQGVVQRFEARISIGRLRDVVVEPQIVEEVIAAYERLSRYIGGHLHPDVSPTGHATPETLIREIEAFDALKKQHRQTKKAS